MTALADALDFELPDALNAHEPPEARGLARDAVRLMVSRRRDGHLAHTRFSRLPDFLRPGDILVVNTSATINAAFDARRDDANGAAPDAMLHLSTPLFEKGSRWVVELRQASSVAKGPVLDAESGERILLPAGGTATLVAPYMIDGTEFLNGRTRLWIADLSLPEHPLAYAARYGSPIRYSYVPTRWPLHYYQTVFAREPGSAEMPSAGRPFTHAVLDELARHGVRIAPVVLHTGVSSLDADEPPYPERFRVPPSTALAVNAARRHGGRVIAVGTTVVRALETVVDDDGSVHAGEGWTDVVITPERGLRATDAILTGLHGPKASHLWMLEALAGREHLQLAYHEVVRRGYLWHEFGDSHLIL